jgi:hypothetical protein
VKSAVAAAIALACWGSGCTASESPLSEPSAVYRHAEQGYMVATPKGWTATMVRGSAQFAPPVGAKSAGRKHTIVIRAQERPAELTEGKPATREDMLLATEKVLRALPRATVGARTAIADSELPAARYSLTFAPPLADGRSYRREHVVIVGSKRLFHVIYTAPAGEAVDEAALVAMASTLTEGV